MYWVRGGYDPLGWWWETWWIYEKIPQCLRHWFLLCPWESPIGSVSVPKTILHSILICCKSPMSFSLMSFYGSSLDIQEDQEGLHHNWTIPWESPRLICQIVLLLGAEGWGLILPGVEVGPNGGRWNNFTLLLRRRGSTPWRFEWLFWQHFGDGYVRVLISPWFSTDLWWFSCTPYCPNFSKLSDSPACSYPWGVALWNFRQPYGLCCYVTWKEQQWLHCHHNGMSPWFIGFQFLR